MDSSVLFLVVIGLWAAFLVPYWLRRREDLSTSRTADRFSAAMRVLSRRPEPDDAVRVRPDVPALLRSPRLELEGSDAGAAAPEVGAPAPLPVARRAPRRRGRAVAGLTLLAALVAVPVLTALSFAGVLLVWAPMPAAAVVVLLVTGLRLTAAPRRRTVPAEVVHGVVHQPEVLEPEPEPVEDVAAAPEREELFDEDAHRRVEEDARIRRLAEEAVRAADVPYREPEPGEWTPVQVPLPSYLLKPHARPAWQPRSQPVAARSGHPVPLGDVDDDDIPTYAPPRRAVNG